MAAVVDTRDVPLRCLTISEGQARVRNVDKELEDLTESIRRHGLLEPIVVCPNGQKGHYDVLMGQRRVMAHRLLGRDRIRAAIINEPVDLLTAKVLSLTENVVRANLDNRDVTDACTALFHKYGSARAVADETGLPYATVLRHVNFDRLLPDLRAMVEAGETGLDVALKAQDAVATADDEVDQGQACELARGMEPMTGAQRRELLRAVRQDRETPIPKVLREFKEERKPHQILVTMVGQTFQAVRAHARSMKVTQDAAAHDLICRGLASADSESGS